MRITLEYGDEDRQEAERAIRVNDYGLVLWDLDQWLRTIQKHSDDKPNQYIMAIDEVRITLNGMMEERGVEFPE